MTASVRDLFVHEVFCLLTVILGMSDPVLAKCIQGPSCNDKTMSCFARMFLTIYASMVYIISAWKAKTPRCTKTNIHQDMKI